MRRLLFWAESLLSVAGLSVCGSRPVSRAWGAMILSQSEPGGDHVAMPFAYRHVPFGFGLLNPPVAIGTSRVVAGRLSADSGRHEGG